MADKPATEHERLRQKYRDLVIEMLKNGDSEKKRAQRFKVADQMKLVKP
jgi:hypothetical protein